MNSTPAVPMYARTDESGTSLNTTALCCTCMMHPASYATSLLAWMEDGGTSATGDPALYPVDNPTAECIDCGASTLWDADTECAAA